MSAKSKMRLLAATVALPVVFIAGCGGGSNNAIPAPTPATTATVTPTSAPPAATNVASLTAIGLTSNNTLVRFNTQTPGSTTPLTFSGLTGGEILVGIDFRFAPTGGGTQGLYALSRTGTNTYQLLRLEVNNANTSATVTRIGTAFTANLTGVGFDYNPQADAFRVVSSTGASFRVNANTGAFVDADANTAGNQGDANLAFLGGDTNQGTTPRVVGVAYTNNDTDASTQTTLFGIDAATNTLVRQGGNNGTPSPNTGQLTTVGSLGTGVGDENNLGFDIGPNGNAGFVTISSGGVTRLYAVNLGNGQLSLVGNVGLAAGTTLVGFAIVP